MVSAGAATENARRLAGALRRRARRTGPPLAYPGIPGRIHPDDDMLHPGDPGAVQYARVGRSAIGAIELALADTGRAFADVGACLDMPCGYGRVLRLLAQAIAPERITACDIDRRAIRFCASEFGVTPLRSRTGLDGLRLGSYDLIWCGSLVTHLDAVRVRRLLAGFAGALRPAGVAIVTIHAEPPTSGEFAPLHDEIADALARRGEFHVPYENALFAYGHAWHTTEHIQAAFAAASSEIRLVGHQPRGWDDHQDVLAFQRADPR